MFESLNHGDLGFHVPIPGSTWCHHLFEEIRFETVTVSKAVDQQRLIYIHHVLRPIASPTGPRSPTLAISQVE
jgi:hypothetical protein